MYSPSTKQVYAIPQPEPVYASWSSHNCLFNTSLYRFEYSSPVTPRCTIEFDMTTKTRKTLKQVEVRPPHTHTHALTKDSTNTHTLSQGMAEASIHAHPSPWVRIHRIILKAPHLRTAAPPTASHAVL